MPVIVAIIMVSLSFYLFYKVKYFRSNRPAEKKWISSKSSIALGLFIALFGFNQLFLNDSTTTYIIAAIFILLGGINIWAGIKAHKLYLPYAISEAQKLDKN